MEVTLVPKEVDGAVCAQLYFIPSVDVLCALQAITGVYLEDSNGQWLMDLKLISYSALVKKLLVAGFYVDYEAFKDLNKIVARKDKRVLSLEQKQELRNYVAYLRGLRLSKSTQITYFGFVADFLEFCGDVPSASLSTENIRLFIEYRSQKPRFSISTHRQFISAIKHFTMFYPNCEIDASALVRPKKSSYLPKVLSQEAIILLIQHTTNLKHRLIIAFLYASGLRVGEIIAIKVEDIDILRRQIFVRQGKGRKDRVVTLAESILPLLKNYLMSYKPSVYLIENPKGGLYSAQSIRSFLKRRCFDLGLKGRITPHTLRHSFATHLVEQGVGLRHIQELLGHSKPETTMIYTHVARKDLLEIKSPLDRAIEALSRADRVQQKPLNTDTISG